MVVLVGVVIFGHNTVMTYRDGVVVLVFHVEDDEANVPLTLSVRKVTLETSTPSSLYIFSYADFSSFGPALTVS